MSKSKKRVKPIELEAKGRGKMPPPGRPIDEKTTRRKRPTKKDLFNMRDD